MRKRDFEKPNTMFFGMNTINGNMIIRELCSLFVFNSVAVIKKLELLLSLSYNSLRGEKFMVEMRTETL